MSDLAKALSRGIQRRMKARIRYRRMRDRKIPVDYLGKWFEYKLSASLPNRAIEWVRCQLVGYDPNTAIVKWKWEGQFPGTWTTDQFWSEYKVGNLRDAA